MIFKKRNKCKHENTQTITNIYGDLINSHKGMRSMVNCIDCGKTFYKPKLDPYCNKSNEFYSKEFHLRAQSLEEVSDGYHTFNELYEHRTYLFAIVCNLHPDLAFKTKKHNDGTMYDGMFLAEIKTPKGYYSYHCDMKYWNLFQIKEIERGPVWDGHKPEDVGRLFSLLNKGDE